MTDQTTPTTPATETWQPIKDAFAAANPIEAMAAIKTSDKTLITLIGAFVALASVLPPDSPAVQAQVRSLLAYKPKATRAPAADKWTPKLALNKLIKAKPIDLTALATLATDERVPADMVAAIQSYVTVAPIESVADDIKEYLLSALRKHGMTITTTSRKPAVAAEVEYNGTTHPTLMAAIKAAGYKAENKVGDSNRPETELVWGRVRPHLLKNGTYTYVDPETYVEHTFTIVKEETAAESSAEQAQGGMVDG